jgi:hypothetical protein
MSATYSLRYFQEDHDRLVPVLSRALTDHSPDVRIRAAMAFDTLDPDRAQNAGVLSVARNCLESDGWRFSTKQLAADFLAKKGKMPPDESD